MPISPVAAAAWSTGHRGPFGAASPRLNPVGACHVYGRGNCLRRVPGQFPLLGNAKRVGGGICGAVRARLSKGLGCPACRYPTSHIHGSVDSRASSLVLTSTPLIELSPTVTDGACVPYTEPEPVSPSSPSRRTKGVGQQNHLRSRRCNRGT